MGNDWYVFWSSEVMQTSWGYTSPVTYVDLIVPVMIPLPLSLQELLDLIGNACRTFPRSDDLGIQCRKHSSLAAIASCKFE